MARLKFYGPLDCVLQTDSIKCRTNTTAAKYKKSDFCWYTTIVLAVVPCERRAFSMCWKSQMFLEWIIWKQAIGGEKKNIIRINIYIYKTLYCKQIAITITKKPSFEITFYVFLYAEFPWNCLPNLWQNKKKIEITTLNGHHIY